MSHFITAADVAKVVGISPDMARRYIAEQHPKKTRKRTRQHFKSERMQELVELCESKRQRRCHNRYNAVFIDESIKG